MPQSTKKILIIEDNESYITILDQKLSIEKFEVITARDGSEGIQKVTNNQPDIVLIDLLLPKMNGIEVIEKIRQTSVGKTLPLIILTNINPDDEIIEKITENKPAYYLVKPEVTLDDIAEKIKNVLQTSQSNS
jgi:two-component system alkaline phosphatase synthesis response regulator PhoP